MPRTSRPVVLLELAASPGIRVRAVLEALGGNTSSGGSSGTSGNTSSGGSSGSGAYEDEHGGQLGEDIIYDIL